MTAILRILEDGDLKWEVALTGVKRIGGVTFYELDLAEIPDIPEPFPLGKGKTLVVRLTPKAEQLKTPVDADYKRDHPHPDDTP